MAASNIRVLQEKRMNKFAFVLGSLLVAASGYLLYLGRQERQADATRRRDVVSAAEAAAKLAEAWSDHRTRA